MLHYVRKSLSAVYLLFIFPHLKMYILTSTRSSSPISLHRVGWGKWKFVFALSSTGSIHGPF